MPSYFFMQDEFYVTVNFIHLHGQNNCLLIRALQEFFFAMLILEEVITIHVRNALFITEVW